MRRRGMTLIELVTGMGLMMLLVLGSMNLLTNSFKSLQRTTSDVTMTDQTSRSLRKLTEKIRPAVTVTITNSGTTLAYNLPKMVSSVDPVTGEYEEVVPVTSDGVAHGYAVNFSAGTLTDTQTGKVLIQNVCSYDPDPNSTLYNKAYVPFQISSIGTYKALTINLITLDATSGQSRVMRMKTTMILRNAQ